jgi:hypothetical protein
MLGMVVYQTIKSRKFLDKSNSYKDDEDKQMAMIVQGYRWSEKYQRWYRPRPKRKY